MRQNRKRNSYNPILTLFVTAAICAAWTCLGFAGAYNACRMPPQISSSISPNLLIVMDYSGSMQLPAYYGEADPNNGYASGGSRVLDDYGSAKDHKGTWTYSPAITYSGLFKSNLYYKYNFDKGWFYSIGDIPDPPYAADGRGTFAVGVSGNLLNWALTSRMDASMAAMIGGKAWDENGTSDCTDSSSQCFLKGEGCRRYAIEGTTTGASRVDAEFFIRPATKWATSFTSANNYGIPSTGADQYYPDDYSTPTDSYPLKDLFVTVRGHFRSTLDIADHDGGSGSNHYWYELWQVTLIKRAYINVTATTSAGYTPVISISRTSSASGTYDGTGSTATYLREPGTYWVKVTTSANNKTGAYMITSNVQLVPEVHAGHNGAVQTSTVGAIPYAAVRVGITPIERTGVIQTGWNKARWGFMYYKGDDPHRRGRLMVSCGEAPDFLSFARNLEGKTTSDHQPYPYEGTPTGEALIQAKYYFQQNKTGANLISENKDKFTPGGQNDPYYALYKGAYTAVSCRKSYIILISDGNWYHNSGSTTEPVISAHDMHTKDLRADVDGDQTVTIFPIFAFTSSGQDYTWGTNAMKWIALYGGHRNLSACQKSGTSCPGNNCWPYPMTAIVTYPSTDTTFNITQCSPPATPNACCKEWDLNPDLYAPGDGLGKGVPDNYFESKTGDKLQEALASIIGQVDQQNASSSAVATVAQQTGEGDVIIRGMFQAKPPASETDLQSYYLWWGHLESYWPDTDGLYEFQLPGGRGDLVMCKDIRLSYPSPWRCWDAAMPSTMTGGKFPTPDSRNIFTCKPESAVVKVSGDQIDFKTDKITPAYLNVSGSTCGTGTDCEKVVKWVRGTDYGDKRPRTDKSGKTWLVGDLVYSTPVVVGPPSLGAVSDKAKALLGSVERGIVACSDPIADSNCAGAISAGFPRNRFFLDWRLFDGSVSDPEDPTVSYAGYPAGYKSIKHRDKFVYVGANDGMLHAFLQSVYDRDNQAWAVDPGDAYTSASSDCSGQGGFKNSFGKCGKQTTDTSRIQNIGKEIWAFIPSNFLSELKNLADLSYGMAEGTGVCKHRFMVDLSPRAWEVFFDDQATSADDIPWHTVLLGGERDGGDMYFALDVTDPHNPKVLWEYSVLKDLVHRFDFSDTTGAAKAFYGACQANPTNPIAPRTSPSPAVGTCQVPVPPASLCTGCTSDSACYNKLKGHFTESALWAPFDNTAYSDLKKLPISWSTPYVGRVKLPVSMNPCAPSGDGKDCEPGTCTGSLSGIRNLAFIGGGVKQFDPDLNMFDSFNATSRAFYQAGFNRALWDPFLLALDIRTGTNVFKYLWPSIDSAASGFFPEKKRGCNASGEDCTLRVPYAMADPTAVDLWDATNNVAGYDGYDDTIYVGDMNGIFYGIKLDFDPASGAGPGIYVDLWRTKTIPVNAGTTALLASNQFRSEYQPITTQPAVTLEPSGSDQLTQPVRVIVGAGKHDDVDGTFGGQDKTDQTDAARMSLYNLRDVIDFRALRDGSAWNTGPCNVKDGTVPGVSGGSLNWKVRANCLTSDCSGPITYRCTGDDNANCNYPVKILKGTEVSSTTWNGCQWYRPSTNSADCCQSSCASPCWQCIFDFPATGEKVIGRPIIVGGNIYVTSFKPTTDDPCEAGGYGYVTVADYLCRPSFPTPPQGSLSMAPGSGPGNFPLMRGELGLGVPSPPVIDSTGTHVIIQSSMADINVITLGDKGPGLPPPQSKMNQIRGWTERDQ